MLRRLLNALPILVCLLLASGAQAQVPEGLSLAIEGVPALLPEGEMLKGKVVLRDASGAPAELSEAALSQITFAVAMKTERLFEGRPDKKGEAVFASRRPLQRGKHTIVATVTSDDGAMKVAPVEVAVVVQSRLSITIDTTTLRFDVTAEEGAIPLLKRGVIKLATPARLPMAITLELTYPEAMLQDMRVSPAKRVTFEPGGSREHVIELAWKDPSALHDTSRHYSGIIKIEPIEEHAKLLVGKTRWQLPVDGHLHPRSVGGDLGGRWSWIVGALVALSLVGVALLRARQRAVSAR